MCILSVSHHDWPWVLRLLLLFTRLWLNLLWLHGLGFSRQEYWGRLPFPFSRGSSWLRDQTCVSCISCVSCVSCIADGGLQLSSVQSLSRVQLFVTPWTAAHQASLSITNSRSPPKPMSIESVMPSNHLILCRPLSPPALSLSQHHGLFQWVSPSLQVAKALEFQLQHQSFQWTLRADFL